MTQDISERLSSWRQAAGIVKQPDTTEQRSDYPATHHRQQLQRSTLLCLENLAAHDQFCKKIEAYVQQGARERSDEHQQRVTDYAGYLLRIYESASSRALEQQIFNILQNLPAEVKVIRTVQAEPARELPQKSWLKRFLTG